MNAGNQSLIILPMDCNSAVLQLTSVLKSAGYLVIKSFDLVSAMPVQGDCKCDPDTCTCQMVVLLVYAQEGPPVTLLFDGNQSQTKVYLVISPSHMVQPAWVGKLTQLFPAALPQFNQITASVE